MMNGDIFKQFWCFLLGGILLLSIYLPETEHLWRTLDLYLFQALNGALDPQGFIAKCWAFLNSRHGDWISELLLVALFLLFYFRRGERSWKSHFFRIVTVAAFISATQLILNKGVFLKIIDVKRLSPSLLTPHYLNLEQLWPFWNNHATSLRSFPADHATSLMIATLWIFHDCGRKYGWAAVALSTLFILPRLVAGAHGLSDILCGSLAITALVAPLFYSLPKEEPTPCPVST